MKAHLNQNGAMTIIPESEIEAYALKKWTDDNIPSDGAGTMSTKNILFRLSAPNEPNFPPKKI